LDEPVESGGAPQYRPDPEWRLSRVETDVGELKSTQAELKAIVARIEAKLDAMLPHLATKADLAKVESRLDSMQATLTQFATRADLAAMDGKLDATLPHLATKADLAEKPSKTYMWGILAALLTAYACGLAALATLK
jgi:gamma-glutamyl:cysteine ligase YbdK (ATP-grasp superfamily)